MEQRPEDVASDQMLMLAVQSGDVGKLGTLFERHSGRLFSFLLRLTGNRQLSEDLVQEAFVRLLKYRHTYRSESKFTTWMFQIARNARIDYLRRHSCDDVNLEEEREYESTLPRPDHHLERNEEMSILLDALDRLPVKKREVLLLRGFEGMKFEEIASVLDCPVNTVKGRAFDAIRELKEAVQNLLAKRVS